MGKQTLSQDIYGTGRLPQQEERHFWNLKYVHDWLQFGVVEFQQPCHRNALWIVTKLIEDHCVLYELRRLGNALLARHLDTFVSDFYGARGEVIYRITLTFLNHKHQLKEANYFFIVMYQVGTIMRWMFRIGIHSDEVHVEPTDPRTETCIMLVYYMIWHFTGCDANRVVGVTIPQQSWCITRGKPRFVE